MTVIIESRVDESFFSAAAHGGKIVRKIGTKMPGWKLYGKLTTYPKLLWKL